MEHCLKELTKHIWKHLILDIACAKAGGINVIAVATGSYSAEELQKTGADLVVRTLFETDKILKFLHIK